MIQTTKKRWWRQGIVAAWPICLGYIPIGMAFGVLAQKAGLSAVEIGMMSLLVFAGSSQFIAVSMIALQASAVSIIATTFMVNLRHLLMSSALSLFLKDARRRKLSVFAYGVTDESFAVNMIKFRGGDWGVNQALTVNHTANIVWILSSVVGGIGGQFIPAGAFGIDYTLIAMFICLLVFQLQGLRYVLTAIIAGAVSVGLALLIPGNSYIVLGSIIAASAGVFMKRGRSPAQESGRAPSAETADAVRGKGKAPR